jgi:hypothetical protein
MDRQFYTNKMKTDFFGQHYYLFTLTRLVFLKKVISNITSCCFSFVSVNFEFENEAYSSYELFIQM